MWRDSVVEEIRAIREEHARQYKYDIRAIFSALKEEEKKSGRKTVSFQPKPYPSFKTGEEKLDTEL
ncbi:MAG: hypothetical protein BWK80_02380 [Desulfobacteraceae bacterium IS3]|nr:MAG: hypothetical protein BWK80_02380 [Desulfobacteraceae bacterium IS3]